MANTTNYENFNSLPHKNLLTREQDSKDISENSSLQSGRRYSKKEKTYLLHQRTPYESFSSPPRGKNKENLLSPLSTKNFGTPTHLKASTMRKRHLLSAIESGDLSASPMQAANQINLNYGFCVFSKMAIEYKKKNEITAGRNVAIIVYKDKDNVERNVIACTSGPPGAPHAELLAYDLLPDYVRSTPERISVVYSERKPCTYGSNCYMKLKAVLGSATKVLWSVDFPEDKTLRRKVKAAFLRMQFDMGIKVSERGKQLIFE